MSVCHGRSEALVFSGSATGDVYIWKEPLLLKTVKAHDGPVFAMFSLDKVSDTGLLLLIFSYPRLQSGILRRLSAVTDGVTVSSFL